MTATTQSARLLCLSLCCCLLLSVGCAVESAVDEQEAASRSTSDDPDNSIRQADVEPTSQNSQDKHYDDDDDARARLGEKNKASREDENSNYNTNEGESCQLIFGSGTAKQNQTKPELTMTRKIFSPAYFNCSARLSPALL